MLIIVKFQPAHCFWSIEKLSLVVVWVFDILGRSFLLEVISLFDSDFGGIFRQEFIFRDIVSLFEIKLLEILDFGVIMGEISLKNGENFFCFELSIGSLAFMENWFYGTFEYLLRILYEKKNNKF